MTARTPPERSWSGTCGAHGPWASATDNSCPSCRGVTMATLQQRATNTQAETERNASTR